MKKPLPGPLGCGFHFGVWKRLLEPKTQKRLLEPKTQRHRQSGALYLAGAATGPEGEGPMGAAHQAVEKVAGTENTGSRERNEKAASWTPGMRFPFWCVEKVAGTENTSLKSPNGITIFQ